MYREGCHYCLLRIIVFNKSETNYTSAALEVYVLLKYPFFCRFMLGIDCTRNTQSLVYITRYFVILTRSTYVSNFCSHCILAVRNVDSNRVFNSLTDTTF